MLIKLPRTRQNAKVQKISGFESNIEALRSLG